MKNFQTLRLSAPAAVFFGSLLLAGCGGGGSDVAATPPPAPTPVVVSGTVSLFAGAFQQPGSTDGPAASARFNSPNAVTQDTEGNVYVADTGSHTIRKIIASGEVSTLAGAAGQSGTVDGVGGAARFATPTAIAVAKDGTIYIGQLNSSAVRKVTPGGVVTTLPGTDPQFNTRALALDATGNLYVVQSDIIKIAPNGSVTTFLPRSAARFTTPFQAISVDSAGNVYVVQLGFPTAGQPAGFVSKYSGQGTAIPFASRQGTGWYENSLDFTYPVAVAADASGNVYVACSGSVASQRPGSSTTCNSIKKITAAGAIQEFAGTPEFSGGTSGSADGVGAAASFRFPLGLVVGPSGKIFVADTGNHVIRQIEP